MKRLAMGAVLALTAVLMAACAEPQKGAPAGPISAAVGTDPLVCSFNLLNRLTTKYFNPAETKTVKALLDAMAAAGPTTATGRDRGFDILARVSQNVKDGNSLAADASNLINNLLVCMYTDAAQLPLNFPEDFTVAADPAQHGGLEVRGGASDPTFAPVLSRPLNAPFSGIAPIGSNSWPQVLGGNPAPSRILAYGRPGPEPQTYDWKIVPRNTEFSPPVVAGVCIDPNSATTSLLFEEHKGLLPFEDAPFLVPGVCSSFATAPGFSTQLAQRLADWTASAFLPKPLSASVLNPGGLGGSTGGIGSIFGPQEVAVVDLTFIVQPSDVTVNQIITPAVVVQATVAGTTTPVPNVQISLISQDNNGQPAQLLGTLTGVTNGSGTVTFSDLSEIKTGGYRLIASGAVIGRPAIGVPAVSSARFNVRP